MSKRPSLIQGMAKPHGQSTGSTAERVDMLQKAMNDAGPSPAMKSEKTVSRSREGMVSTGVWMPPKARKSLKILAMQKDEGLEEFIIKAINARLIEQGADFIIE